MKTFKQLLDATYKGPFEIDEQDDGVFIGAPDAEPLCKMFHQFADPDTPRENAEMVTRLLNFAYAGGTDALAELANLELALWSETGGEWWDPKTNYSHKVPDDLVRLLIPAVKAARAALAILNGEATP